MSDAFRESYYALEREVIKAHAERDEILSALRSLVHAIEATNRTGGADHGIIECLGNARAVLARVEGSAS